ncbi:MAG: hypothetical protein LKI39_14775 [Bacteroides sp.]|jgi:hypothetical protein|nr:hypothetical protein [Bacteroides sp.]
MTNSINDRINQIKIKFFGDDRGSHKQFIEKIGVASNTASNWIKEGYNIGRDVITKILKAFPEVNARWLITGDGEMLINISGDPISNEIEIEYKNTIRELEAELNQLKGENKILREMVGLQNKEAKNKTA